MMSLEMAPIPKNSYTTTTNAMFHIGQLVPSVAKGLGRRGDAEGVLVGVEAVRQPAPQHRPVGWEEIEYGDEVGELGRERQRQFGGGRIAADKVVDHPHHEPRQ